MYIQFTDSNSLLSNKVCLILIALQRYIKYLVSASLFNYLFEHSKR